MSTATTQNAHAKMKYAQRRVLLPQKHEDIMRRLLARLWLHFNRAEYCWPHTEPFCTICARQRVEKSHAARDKKCRRVKAIIACAKGKP
jgi:hypothetical protein